MRYGRLGFINEILSRMLIDHRVAKVIDRI